MDFFSQNLCATHTERAKSSGSPCVAAGLRGDGPAREHLATDVEAAHRGTTRRLTDVYCSPGQRKYILSFKRLMVPRCHPYLRPDCDVRTMSAREGIPEREGAEAGNTEAQGLNPSALRRLGTRTP